MSANHYIPLPAPEQPKSARLVALGMAASVLLGGCGAISEAVDNAKVEYTVMQMEGQGAYDYSIWSACAEPTPETPEPIIERIAKQCRAEGSKNADLVVVDLTDSSNKTIQFMDGLQDGVAKNTKGHFTIKPRLYEAMGAEAIEHIEAALFSPEGAEPCVDIDDTKTAPSSVILDEFPALKQVPYVVVLSKYPSCENKASGLRTGPNSVDIFNYDEIENAIDVGGHELGHLLHGLSHVGTLAPKGAEDPSRYILTTDDLTFGEVNLKYYAILAKYHEYVPSNAADGNIMGAAHNRQTGGFLMPHQEDQLHWWDSYVGDSYSPKVTTIGTEVIEFKPTDSSNRAGLALLEEPITIPGNANDKDMVANGVLFQPITGFDENIGEVVESVYISLVSTEGSKTALIGYLTQELSGERSWELNLGPNKTLHLNSISGPLLAHITD